MTHPKQALTPGQAAREAYARARYAGDGDAIAAAAIEAAKQSGDLVERTKAHDILDAAQKMSDADIGAFANDIAAGKYDDVMPGIALSTPPTENKDERPINWAALAEQHHCELVADSYQDGLSGNSLRDCILRERAAAGKAEYERGFNARNEIKDKTIDALEQEIISFGSPPWMYSKLKIETDAQLAALQSQLTTLLEAAEAVQGLIDQRMGSDFDGESTLCAADPEWLCFRAAVKKAREGL